MKKHKKISVFALFSLLPLLVFGFCEEEKERVRNLIGHQK